MAQSPNAEFAVLGLPALVDLLRAQQVIVHGSDAGAVMEAVNSGFSARGFFPVVLDATLAGPTIPLLKSKLRDDAEKEMDVVVIGDTNAGIDGAIHLPSPTTFDAVLEAVGYDPAPAGGGGDRQIAVAVAEAPTLTRRRRQLPGDQGAAPVAPQAPTEPIAPQLQDMLPPAPLPTAASGSPLSQMLGTAAPVAPQAPVAPATPPAATPPAMPQAPSYQAPAPYQAPPVYAPQAPEPAPNLSPAPTQPVTPPPGQPQYQQPVEVPAAEVPMIEFHRGDLSAILAAIRQYGGYSGTDEAIGPQLQKWADNAEQMSVTNEALTVTRKGGIPMFRLRMVEKPPVDENEFDFDQLASGNVPDSSGNEMGFDLLSGQQGNVVPQQTREPMPRQRQTTIQPNHAPMTGVDSSPVDYGAGITSTDMDEMLVSSGVGSSAGSDRIRNAHVIIVTSGKGGVGKTTTSIMLAKTAAMALTETGEPAIQKVLLIDGNRGQNDVQKILKVNQRTAKIGVPTISQFGLNGDPRGTIITPKMMTDLRSELLQRDERQKVDFSVVFAPPNEKGNREATPARFYSEVIAWARRQYDLIIIDTQLIEGQETDLFEETYVPLINDGAYVLGIAELTMPGIEGLENAFKYLGEKTGKRERFLTMVSMFDGEMNATRVATFQKRFAAKPAQVPGENFIGATARDAEFAVDINRGILSSNSPAISGVMKNILGTVTGNEAFDVGDYDPDRPVVGVTASAAEAAKGKKKRWWSRG